MSSHLFTSESVSAGHPDKLADQISDAVLDAALTNDSHPAEVRCACETLIKGTLIVVAGEIRTEARLDYGKIACDVVREAGYGDKEIGMDLEHCVFINGLTEQSGEVARSVDPVRGRAGRKRLGAGDQGIMFGFACRETSELMPLSVVVAHELLRKQAALRQKRGGSWLRPDAKSQVTVRHDDNGRPVEFTDIVVSTQHAPIFRGAPVREFDKRIYEAVREEIVEPVLRRHRSVARNKVRTLVNPSGSFVTGGPQADAGLTGRKIIVDTYGGAAPHGGGAFSGKDPTKVDRSAAYAARHVAKNVVHAGLAERCLVQISYAIGKHEPVSLSVQTQGTGTVEDEEIARRVVEVFDLTPDGIIGALDLLRPIYQSTAVYGHFGRSDLDLPWEKLDKAEQLRDF